MAHTTTHGSSTGGTFPVLAISRFSLRLVYPRFEKKVDIIKKAGQGNARLLKMYRCVLVDSTRRENDTAHLLRSAEDNARPN